MRKKISLQAGASAGALCALLLVACGGDDSVVQPYPSNNTGGTGGSSAGSAGAGGKNAAGAAGSSGATAAGSGGLGGSAGAGGGAGLGGSVASGGASGSAGAPSGGAAGTSAAGQGGSAQAGTGGATAGTGGAAGSSTSCAPTQTFCSNACVDLNSDESNCGTCGFLCGIGASCEAGKCVLSCGVGLVACGDLCVDTQSSSRNCGQCGTVCADGQVCNGGTCSATCAAGKTSCTTGAGTSECVDVKSDNLHCGACGTACAPNQACNAGVCELSCTGTTKKCGDTCVDQGSDATNCGGCGVKCVGSETCQSGVCKVNCDLPNRLCGGLCIDPTSNNANCGSCGNACQGAETCSAGECKIVCDPGQSICGGKCVDKSTDGANCGSCGNACAVGQACVAGACKVVCAAGENACGNTCFDLQTSTTNCGSCGNACGAGQVCASGTCKTNCPSGQTTCGGSCVDLATDNGNCGTCGTKCALGATCGASACACPSGQSVCNGVCLDTKADDKNCGACGNVCGVDETCQAGTCTATCQSQLAGNPLKDRWGYVWDGLERTSTNLAAAETTCSAIGARLPTATEIHRASAARTSDVGQIGQANYLWTNVPYNPTTQMSARLNDGTTTTTAVTSNQTYRCVCAPPPTPGYGGADCIGSAKAECAEFTREGKTYLIDKVDRALLPAGPAEWECQFSGGTLPATDTYVDLMTRASGIGTGNNAWHHTSDQARYEANMIVAWGNEGSWVPNTSTFSWSYFYTPRTFRCMGPKGGVPAVSSAKPADAFVIPGTNNALDAANRGGSTFQGALDTCVALGGHLPITNDIFDGIIAGLGGGSNSWLWTSDQTAYNGTNFTVGLISWPGVARRFQYVHSGALGAVTWTYKHDAQLNAFRCGYPAVDTAYTGPTAAQCYTLPCQKFQTGGAGSGALWMDKLDRPASNWPAAISVCQQAGGRVASERDYAEAVRQGLGGGGGALVWTSDSSGYTESPYSYVHVVKWSGTAQSFDDTYSTYMTWDYPTASHPFRCAFTNEYR